MNLSKKISYIVFVILVLSSCDNFSMKKGDAEDNYQKAFEIINSTTHNALSKSQAFEALENIDTALSINAKESKYYRVKGTIYIHLKKYNRAIENFKKAIKIDSNNSLAWMGLGIAYENTLQFQLAEQRYLRALKDEKLAKSVYANLGLLYNKWGKYNESIESYNKVIEIDSESRIAYSGRGNARMALKNYHNALLDFNQAIRISPKDKLSYNSRGLAKHYLGLYQEAIIDFEKSIDVKQNDSYNEGYGIKSFTFNNMANSYFLIGNYEKACVNWKEALKLGYKYQDEWKLEFGIEDPNILIETYCK